MRGYELEALCGELEALVKISEVRARAKDERISAHTLLYATEMCAQRGSIEKAEGFLLDAAPFVLRSFVGIPSLMGVTCLQLANALALLKTDSALARALEYIEVSIGQLEECAHPLVSSALDSYGKMIRRWIGRQKCGRCRSGVVDVVCAKCDQDHAEKGDRDDTDSKLSLQQMLSSTVKSTNTSGIHKAKTRKDKQEEATRQAAALAGATTGMVLTLPHVTKKDVIHMLEGVASSSAILRRHRYLCNECATVAHLRSPDHKPFAVLFPHTDTVRVFTRALQLMNTGYAPKARS